jgi:hypothetical protein
MLSPTAVPKHSAPAHCPRTNSYARTQIFDRCAKAICPDSCDCNSQYLVHRALPMAQSRAQRQPGAESDLHSHMHSTLSMADNSEAQEVAISRWMATLVSRRLWEGRWSTIFSEDICLSELSDSFIYRQKSLIWRATSDWSSTWTGLLEILRGLSLSLTIN